MILVMEKHEAIKAMESVAKFISDALELTKRINPNSYDQEIYQELAEQCAIVLIYLKND